MPGFIGLPELLILLVVVLLVFGPKRLPEMGRSLGRGMREFKDSVSGNETSKNDEPAVHEHTALPPASSFTQDYPAAPPVPEPVQQSHDAAP